MCNGLPREDKGRRSPPANELNDESMVAFMRDWEVFNEELPGLEKAGRCQSPRDFAVFAV